MGNLFDEVMKDQRKLEEQTQDLVIHLVKEARTALEHYGRIRPVAGAIVGLDVHVWPLPLSRTKRELRLSSLNKQLREDNATSTVFAYEHDQNVIIAVQTPNHRELTAIPFSFGDDGIISWGTARSTKNFSVVLHGPCVS